MFGYNSFEDFIKDVPSDLNLKKNKNGQLFVEAVSERSSTCSENIKAANAKSPADICQENMKLTSFETSSATVHRVPSIPNNFLNQKQNKPATLTTLDLKNVATFQTGVSVSCVEHQSKNNVISKSKAEEKSYINQDKESDTQFSSSGSINTLVKERVPNKLCSSSTNAYLKNQCSSLENLCPEIKNGLASASLSALLHLHFLLLGALKMNTLKTEILSFTGFPFPKDSEKWKLKESFVTRFPLNMLRQCLDVFCIPYVSEDVKKILLLKLIEYFEACDKTSVKNNLKGKNLNLLLHLHFLLLGTKNLDDLRKDILSFTGFSFSNSSKNWKRKEHLISLLSTDTIKCCLNILCIDYNVEYEGKTLKCMLRKFLETQTKGSVKEQYYFPAVYAYPFNPIIKDITNTSLSVLLHLNFLLYGVSSMDGLKKEVSTFAGFPFYKDSEKWKKKENLLSLFSLKTLKLCLNLLCIQFDAKEDKNTLLSKLIEFLGRYTKPSVQFNPSPSLGTIINVSSTCMSFNAVLHLHFLLFGALNMDTLKTEILSFTGFPFTKESEEWIQKENALPFMSLSILKKCSNLLCMEHTATDDNDMFLQKLKEHLQSYIKTSEQCLENHASVNLYSRIKNSITYANLSDLLNLHYLLVGKSSMDELKQEVLSFSGFPFSKDSKEWKQRKDLISQMSLKEVKLCLNILSVQFVAEDSESILRQRLMEFWKLYTKTSVIGMNHFTENCNQLDRHLQISNIETLSFSTFILLHFMLYGISNMDGLRENILSFPGFLFSKCSKEWKQKECFVSQLSLRTLKKYLNILRIEYNSKEGRKILISKLMEFLNAYTIITEPCNPPPNLYPQIKSNIKNASLSALLHLHFIYSGLSSMDMLKNEILSFTGFSYSKDSEEWKQKRMLLSSQLSSEALKQCLTLLCIKFDDEDDRNTLLCKLIEFVEAQFETSGENIWSSVENK